MSDYSPGAADAADQQPIAGERTPQRTLFGHPAGLYTLFFAEMWERFSYYGMRALLMLYMTKGFLEFGDGRAYTIYGAYTALVYMTPFFGGLLADRLIGQRMAVVLGGLLMAAGHLLMTVEDQWPFYFALALLIAGNGFFKPNISTIVGTLYPEGSGKRDAGFTIFYMGINLGAAMSPLLCGYIGETYGWHYGFGLATIGMLVGLAIFCMPSPTTQALTTAAAIAAAVGLYYGPGTTQWEVLNWLIGADLLFTAFVAYFAMGAQLPNRGQVQAPLSGIVITGLLLATAVAASSWALFEYHTDNPWTTAFNIFIGIALLTAGVIGCIALSRGGLPTDVGNPPQGTLNLLPFGLVLAGVAVAIPCFAFLVSGYPFDANGEPFQLIEQETIARWTEGGGKLSNIAATFLEEVSKPAGLVLTVIGVLAFGYLIFETFRLDRIPRHRMVVALVLIFFQMLFFAFFEQAGSSVNLFTDRNVDRVVEDDVVTSEMVGQTIPLEPTQEQVGYTRGEQQFTLSDLNDLRRDDGQSERIDWPISEDDVGMGLADRGDELPASIFQSVNPGYILILGLAFSALWTYLGNRNADPSAPVKFALGLMQLGLGFGVFWLGARWSDERGMVMVTWLLLGYLLHTTGELCLSPVGLSTMTKLSPRILVSTVMGAWFLATAFSQYLAAIISQFTNVSEGAAGENVVIPPPSDTVMVYGGVFGQIAILAIASGVLCLLLSPLLTAWMHQDHVEEE